MDDADLDFSNPEVIESFLNDFPKDTTHHHACTHTHTCNPPGPDLSHTHTCFHVHTQIVPAVSSDDPGVESAEKSSSKKRPFGNREAVRKYREKKKARAASLEDEVVQLRTLNQQLMRRLQGQAALEAEVLRLRCLLVDIRGRIEGEIGSFPYQKPVAPGNLMSGAHVLNSCELRCDDQVHCLQGKPGVDNGVVNGQGFSACEMGSVQCMGNFSSGSEFLGCGRGCPDANEGKGAGAEG
ncbi:basic leucine zipper 19-like [Dioscorea cayenensis subsp. rotundata]|uniref:Basic leucine zipper 19-like n=1 Tax=Dioscorea cayennensis subsp. rotundata TaxID=55577 RepID=A0AB40C5S8_DIOCR|nr:basic leucine zipper 19-like [Dioscorea cayenensis subsp. rotundata]